MKDQDFRRPVGLITGGGWVALKKESCFGRKGCSLPKAKIYAKLTPQTELWCL